jgi:hypothetical protein
MFTRPDTAPFAELLADLAADLRYQLPRRRRHTAARPFRESNSTATSSAPSEDSAPPPAAGAIVYE